MAELRLYGMVRSSESCRSPQIEYNTCEVRERIPIVLEPIGVELDLINIEIRGRDDPEQFACLEGHWDALKRILVTGFGY
jgi:hypothetical protein